MRTRGSIRRTLTLDGWRPDGPRGELFLRGAARDLYTGPDGAAEPLCEHSVFLSVDFVETQQILQIDFDPPDVDATALIGVPCRRGFRRAAAEVVGESTQARALLLANLDDVPIVSSLSRVPLFNSGVVSRDPSSPNFLGNRGSPSVERAWDGYEVRCAGWAPDSTLTRLKAQGVFGSLLEPERAPAVLDGHDAAAWHDVDPLPSFGLRRSRRIDLSRTSSEQITVESWWRDAYRAADESPVVQHEYSVSMVIHARTREVVSGHAVARVLPGPECSLASASVGMLAGRRVSTLASTVNAELTGFETCTHLNDHFRAVGFTHGLIDRLAVA